MKSLIQKIFTMGRDNKQKITANFTADEIKPIFQSLGINIETIGFPGIDCRHERPIEAYLVNFEDVKITPVKVDKKVSTIITGKYEIQAVASYQDKHKDWYPGNVSHYNFKIQEGKLNLKWRN